MTASNKKRKMRAAPEVVSPDGGRCCQPWRQFSRILATSLTAVCAVTLIGLGPLAYSLYQDRTCRAALDKFGGDYIQEKDLPRALEFPPRKDVVGDWWYDFMHRDFIRVAITRGNPDDEQLQFLGLLRTVQAVELRSNRATDQTLEIVSQLPQLRELTIDGDQFSVFGLLQLREARRLKSLTLDTQQLTTRELAALRSELSDVLIRDLAAETASPYYEAQIAREQSVYDPPA